MRRFLVTSAVAVAVMTATTPTEAGATPPRHVEEEVDLHYPLDFYTDRCGFPVEFSLTGTIRTTLLYNRSGSITREVDTQPGATLTYSSPTTGRSFSWPFATIAHFEYESGGAIGTRATTGGGGVYIKVPGVAAEAGHVVFDGVVVDVTPQGVPIVAFTGVIAARGHSNDPEIVDAAICSALAPDTAG